jgi:hypothetical protein
MFSGKNNYRALLILFLFTFLIVLMYPGLTLCQTYYIDYANGSDSNSGTSKSSPWKRCPGMVGFAGSYSHSAGDVFIFKGGVTWTSAALPLTVGYSGTYGNIDTYTADQTWYSGGSWSKPIFDMENTDAIGIQATSKSYVTIDNIKIIKPANQRSGYDENMIKFDSTTGGMTIQNCTLDGIDGSNNAAPIRLRNVDGVTIDNNYIRGRGGDGNPDGIIIIPWFNMKNITIKNNEITMTENGGDGTHIDLNNDDYDTDRMFVGHYGPILIENNLYHDIAGVKMGIIIIGGARDLTIRYNKFYGTYGDGVGVRFGNANQGYDMDGSAGGPYYWWYENVQVYYNLFYQTCDSYPSWGAMISHQNTNNSPNTTGNVIYNNVLWADGSYPINQRGMFFESDTGNGWTVKNNIFMGLTQSIVGGSSAIINNNIFYGNEYDNVKGTNPILSDPKFVDAANGNFHIQSDSSAKDVGIDWGQTRDFAGVSKQGSAWGIGAYEYILLPPKNLRLP